MLVEDSFLLSSPLNSIWGLITDIEIAKKVLPID